MHYKSSMAKFTKCCTVDNKNRATRLLQHHHKIPMAGELLAEVLSLLKMDTVRGSHVCKQGHSLPADSEL